MRRWVYTSSGGIRLAKVVKPRNPVHKVGAPVGIALVRGGMQLQGVVQRPSNGKIAVQVGNVRIITDKSNLNRIDGLL